jgi:deazaflavin-dependent oxidoreductase (nitroreductase family)
VSLRLKVLIPLALVIAGLTAFFKVLFVREAVRRRMFPIMRPLYKQVFNPRALEASARQDAPWGVVHHVGRQSGRSYETPIDAQPTSAGVLIPLVYGAQADWCRNILAAGGCTLTLAGTDVELTDPQVISWAVAEPQLSEQKARFWHGIGIEHVLSLKTVQSVQPESESSSLKQA